MVVGELTVPQCAVPSLQGCTAWTYVRVSNVELGVIHVVAYNIGNHMYDTKFHIGDIYIL